MPTVMSSGPDSFGRPLAARELLGRHLRTLRERQTISRGLAARFIEGSVSKTSRLELGDIAVKEGDLDRLLDLYAVKDRAERLALLQLACQLNHRQWWHDYKDLLEGWFCSYLVLESVAAQIRTYEVRFLPGLLQTRQYAEAVMRLQHRDEDEIQRQGNTRLWAVVDPAALSLHLGNAQVMRDQLGFLIEATERPNVTIQILKKTAAASAAAGNSFSTLRLRIQDLSDVVYLEQIDSAMFLDSPHERDPYEIAWNRLSINAKAPDEARSHLRQDHDASD